MKFKNLNFGLENNSKIKSYLPQALTLFVIVFIVSLILKRPYIKTFFNEFKFTYFAKEYKSPKSSKLKKKKEIINSLNFYIMNKLNIKNVQK